MLKLKSFIWGGIAAAIFVGIGFLTGNVLLFSIIAAVCFTHISCLILDNNIVQTVIVEACGWSFRRFIDLALADFNGVFALITLQIILVILALLLSIIFDLLAIAFSFVLSVFIYPYALIKSIIHKE